MGYDDLFLHGEKTEIRPGDLMVIRLQDAAVAFRRKEDMLDMHLSTGATDPWCLHFGHPLRLAGVRHVHVAGDVARLVDLRVRLVESDNDRVIYEFSK